MPLHGGGGATHAAAAAASQSDPDEDVLGWENGVWHNESIAVDSSDGLNDTELDRVVDRTMARVEFVRELEFEEDVPVSVVGRREFREQQRGRDVSEQLRRFDNAKFEALMMIDESTDSIAVQEENRQGSILGFYDPQSDEIVLVSENGTDEGVEEIDELTLAHELLHALQDQQYDLTSFERTTREQVNTVNGLVEGDPELLEVLYEQRCGEVWNECFVPEGGPDGGDGELANIGPFILKFQPRSDGAAFVEQVREEGGWDAVDELYEDPPASTEQFIHPEKYPDDEPTEVEVADRSTDEWEQIRVPDRPDAGVLGEAGMFSMLLFPAFDSMGETQVIPGSSFRNVDESGELDPVDPLNYSHPLSAGWDGDGFVAYASDETPRNETAYVWKFAWDSERDAQEFVEGYRELLAFRNAEPVEDRENTYSIPEGERFADAFYVRQEGDTVVIVNAPTVEDLSDVRESAAPETDA
ncbi:hypothetical protein BRC82_01945 [Halobacteriales archaeon QS_1_67_19]|nr:MAG: hypothetical protein BRC82_01945 [Halobacteriales archaeon QS_1_67_19]